MIKKKLIGTFSLNVCPNITEIISKKLDYVIIDREHGPHDFLNTNLLVKIVRKNSLCLIRASSLSRIEIQRCLDLNPDGVLIPQISSYNDAKLAVSYSFFHPKGTRGLSPYTASFNFNHSNSENKKKLINKKLFLGLLIEGEKGLEALPKIIEELSANISLIYFGLYDFSSSLGLKPDWSNKKVINASKKIINLCRKKNVMVGSIARTVKEITFLKKIGINFICYQNDTGIIFDAFEKLNELKIK